MRTSSHIRTADPGIVQRSVASSASGGAFRFTDNRPEHSAQQAVQLMANNAGAMQPVVQLYRPGDHEKGNTFKIKPKGYNDWVNATLVSVNYVPLDDSDSEEEESEKIVNGWEFQIGGEKGTVFIQSDRQIHDPDKTDGASGWLYDPVKTSTECQYPGCGTKYDSTADLDQHVRDTHPFPVAEHYNYPYNLFGAQGADTIILNKQEDFGKSGPPPRKKQKLNNGAELVKSSTKDQTHSEWTGSEHLQHVDGEYSATSSIGEFMEKGETAPRNLYYTPVPHCGYCTHSLEAAGLPHTYPTLADPTQSKAYTIPLDALHKDEIEDVLRKKSTAKKKDKKTSSNIVIGKDDLRKLPTRQEHNKRVNKENKGEDEEGGTQYSRFQAQAMYLNKWAIENSFSKWKGTHMDRDAMKRHFTQYPVPMNPETFDYYPPSPFNDYNSDEDKGLEAKRKELEVQAIIRRIAEAWEEIRAEKSTKSLDKNKEIDPAAVNNCLITAINGGTPASLDTARQIRYLVRNEVGTAYGAFLQAEPQVIAVIANVLGLEDTYIRIFQNGELQQLFYVTATYNVVEFQGDEIQEEYENAEPGAAIDISHTGGNHFESGIVARKKKKEVSGSSLKKK